MPKRQIAITVLMPVCNSAGYIKSSMKSILNQTFKEFEFLIIDYGSADNTEEIIKSFSDSRIIYKKTEHKGYFAALNYGLAISAGNWVARIDSDNLNVPVRLQKQTEFIANNPDYDIISSWSVYFKDPCKILYFLKEPVKHEEIYNFLNLHNPINSSSVIYKKSIIKKAKYNENLNILGDFELFFRIRDEAKFYNIPEFLTYNRLKINPDTYEDEKNTVFEIINDFALKKLINSTRKRDLFYWTSIIAGQNFFYGDRRNSRSYLKKVRNLKNILSLASTYLPGTCFNCIVNSKLDKRCADLFSFKKSFKNELKELLC